MATGSCGPVSRRALRQHLPTTDTIKNFLSEKRKPPMCKTPHPPFSFSLSMSPKAIPDKATLPDFPCFFPLLTVSIFLFFGCIFGRVHFPFFRMHFCYFPFFPDFPCLSVFSPADLPHVRFFFWLHFAIFSVFCSMPGVGSASSTNAMDWI